MQADSVRRDLVVHLQEAEARPSRRAWPRVWGDCWTWTAICADTKLIPCWHVGTRDADAAAIFIEDLASRLANRVQLSTDGHKVYLSAVENAFGWNGVDYAMLEKVYAHPGAAPEAAKRYSPSDVVGVEKKWVIGKPDERISRRATPSRRTRGCGQIFVG